MNEERLSEVVLEVPPDSRFAGVVRASVDASMGEGVGAEDRLELSAAVSEAVALVRYHSLETGSVKVRFGLDAGSAKVEVFGPISRGDDEEFPEERAFAEAILASLVDRYEVRREAGSMTVSFSKALSGI